MNRLVGPGAAYAQGFGTGIQQGNALAVMRREQEREDLFRQHGAGIAAGDPAAMNALAGLDPMAAFGMNRQRAADGRTERQHELAMRTGEKQLEVLGAQEARAVAEYARGLSAEQRAQEIDQLEKGVAAASAFAARGDFDGLSQYLAQNGIDVTVGSMAEYEALLLRVNGSLDILRDVQGATKPDYHVTRGGQFYDKNNPAAGAQVVPGLVSDGSAGEQKIARLISTGMSREVAIGIADGRYVTSRDPMTGQALILDKATGQPVQALGQTAPPPIAQPQPQPAQAEPQARQPLTFGDRFDGGDTSFGMGGRCARPCQYGG